MYNGVDDHLLSKRRFSLLFLLWKSITSDEYDVGLTLQATSLKFGLNELANRSTATDGPLC